LLPPLLHGRLPGGRISRKVLVPDLRLVAGERIPRGKICLHLGRRIGRNRRQPRHRAWRKSRPARPSHPPRPHRRAVRPEPVSLDRGAGENRVPPADRHRLKSLLKMPVSGVALCQVSSLDPIRANRPPMTNREEKQHVVHSLVRRSYSADSLIRLMALCNSMPNSPLGCFVSICLSTGR